MDFSSLRMTVDDPKDFVLVEQLVQRLGFRARWQEYALEIVNSPDLRLINQKTMRNEGYQHSLEREGALS